MRAARLALVLLVLLLVSGRAVAATVSVDDSAPLPPETVVKRLSAPRVEEALGREHESRSPLPPTSWSSDIAYAPTTEVVFSNGFETLDPWSVYGYGWSATTYRAFGGAWSAYCAGYFVPPPGPYVPNMETWLIAGPFNLDGYDSAQLDYRMWGSFEPEWDVFRVGASVDGEYFYMNENSAGGVRIWTGDTPFDLTEFCGESEVWIAFLFESNASTQLEGVYIDDVSITGTHRPPVAMTVNCYYLHPDTAKTVPAPGVLADVSGHGPFSVSKLTDPAMGTVTLNPDGSLVYTPNPGVSGVDTFTFLITDRYGGTNTATAGFCIGNTGPIANLDEYTVQVGTSLTVPDPGVLANDVDREGDAPLTAAVVNVPSHGLVVLNPSGGFTYTPSAGYAGPDQFTYRASDGSAQSGICTVQLTISPPTPPATRVAVYRFYCASTGTHFYTSDPVEMQRVRDTMASTYSYEGIGYYINTSNPANSINLYRFYNTRTGTHLYTADEGEKNSILANLSAIYTLDGVAYTVSMSTGTQVHRFYSPSKGAHFYSSDPGEIAYVQANLAAIWRYEGPAYYVEQ